MTLNPPLPSEEPTVGVAVAVLGSTAADDPASPSAPPVPPIAGSTRRAAAGSGSRTAVVSVAVALVSVLAGSAMFFAGFSLGRQSALTPGTPSGDADAF